MLNLENVTLIEMYSEHFTEKLGILSRILIMFFWMSLTFYLPLDATDTNTVCVTAPQNPFPLSS